MQSEPGHIHAECRTSLEIATPSSGHHRLNAHLVTQALPSSGGHHNQVILTPQDTLYHIQLVGAETGRKTRVDDDVQVKTNHKTLLSHGMQTISRTLLHSFTSRSSQAKLCTWTVMVCAPITPLARDRAYG